MLDHREHSWIEADEPDHDAGRALSLLRFGEHLERRVLEVEHAAEVERYDPGRGLGDQRPKLLADALRVREEDPPLGAHEEQPGKDLVLGMLARPGPEDVRARLPPERV